MKNLFASCLILALILCPLGATAATLEKSRLRSDNSYLDVEKNIFVYRDNVVYEHGNMKILADSLTKQGENAGTITALGNPVKIHYVDENGETTDIDAPKIIYHQQSGALSANGDILIVQTSGTDTLKLKGDQLKANQAISEGFSFVLSGQPTEFRLQQPGQALIVATAEQLRSNGKDKQTQLVGNVKLQQGDSNMTAALLTYDGSSKVISAGKGESDGQQVETEFYWEQNGESSSQDNSEQPAEDESSAASVAEQQEK